MRAAIPVDRYSAVAITLHWVMALGIVALVLIGLSMTHLALPPNRLFQLYQLHKSIGITVLLAALLRLVWRLYCRPPALPAGMPKLEKRAAEGAHVLLYTLMIGLPLTGWVLVSVSAFNIPTVLYGIVPWPHVPVLDTLKNKASIEPVFKLVHAYGAYLLIALVTVHAAAALRHHFLIGDDVLRRMLPAFGRKRATAPKEIA